jgi:hypothetical protein
VAVIELKPEEALVLIEFLLRFCDDGELSIAHQAEQRALWDLCAVLESQVPEILASDYHVKLDKARELVADDDFE